MHSLSEVSNILVETHRVELVSFCKRLSIPKMDIVSVNTLITDALPVPWAWHEDCFEVGGKGGDTHRLEDDLWFRLRDLSL